jgi:hypothetical protein
MSYPNLPNVTDPALQKALKVIADRLNALEARQRLSGTAVLPTLVNTLNFGNQRLTGIGTPIADTDGVTLALVNALLEQAITQNVALVKTPSTTPVVPPVIDPGNLTCNQVLALGQPAGIPSTKRWFKGNFCGVHVAGLPVINGSSSDPTLVFSPFLDRYSPGDQARILTAHLAHGYTHFKLSWPDSRDGNGQSIAQFVATCLAVQTAGFYPVVFLAAKGNDDPANYNNIVGPVVSALVAAGVLPICCVGWELSLWMSPTQVQQAIDFLVSQGITEAQGHNLYVHFQTGYAAFQQPGNFTSAFWQANVGKLTGLLWQADPAWSCGFLQAKANDVQVRCAGQDGWPNDSGFGHPIDCVADELTAMTQFFSGLSEGAGDQQGFNAICSPGPVPIMGSNNGFHT